MSEDIPPRLAPLPRDRWDDEVRAALTRRGHVVNPQSVIGAGMGMIYADGDTLYGSSCWRADGTPVGIGGGMARRGLRFRV